MKTVRYTLSALAISGMLGTAAFADSNQQQNNSNQSSNSSQSSATTQPSAKAPDGFVLFREDVVWVTANEPQNHFLRAMQWLNDKNAKAAAGEMRVAASYLDMQATRGTDEGNQLAQTAENLRHLAQQMDQSQNANAKADRKQLKQTFAQADVALAQHLQSLAKTEYQGQKKIMAGHDLLTATDSISAAYAWTNQQPDQKLITAVQDAQRVADQLLTPVGGASQYSQRSDEQAQPAAAKMEKHSNQQNQSASDPAKTIDELGSAIQSAHFTGSQSNAGHESNNSSKSGK